MHNALAHEDPTREHALPELSVDLVRASRRSDDFPSDWSDAQRIEGERRYRQWLELKRRNPGARLAPTRNIDLFWHLHMLAPVAYLRDCTRLFGRVLDHDGGFGKDPAELPTLQAVYADTARLWESTWGTAYADDGTRVDDQLQKCWHDCQSRCWHACSN